MGKLILVRHGETAANRDRFFAQDDTPLTDLGREQAREAASAIAGRFRPNAIVSSPLTRARQTAEIIGTELGLAVETMPGLEECDFGALKGKPYSVYHETISADPTFDRTRPWLWISPQGESTEQTRCRVAPLLDRLRDRFPEDEVLVVCHGMVMVAVWAHLSGKWEGVDVPPNCALIVLEHNGTGFGPPLLIAP